MNDIIKIIILIVALVIVRLLSNTYINLSHLPKNNVHDICHVNLPNLPVYLWSNYIYDLFTVIPIILMFCLTILKNDNRLLYEFLATIIMLNLIRPIFFAITILPDPSEKCVKNKHLHSKFYEFFTGSCRDMIFSAHVGNSLMALLFLIHYYKLPIFYAVLHQAILISVMLCQKKHYTIDIIIAYMVTFILFDHRKFITSMIGL